MKRKEEKGENKQATKTRFGTKQQAARCLENIDAVIFCGVWCTLMLLYFVVSGAHWCCYILWCLVYIDAVIFCGVWCTLMLLYFLVFGVH
ncbi:hypothetical protein ACROYT_G037685 [Oculina patagonica]